MTVTIDAEDFVARLQALAARPGRHVAALAGPPGAGKSTLAEMAVERLGAACAILPMDGFHYDDSLLNARGWRPRKGAPHTFDVGGLAATLARLRAGDEDAVAVPVFDRAIEIARAGARLIDRETPLILVEGNYLLLSAAPWSALRAHFDRTALIRVDPAVLERRLSRRWLDAGLDPAEAARRVRENDMPNGLTVLTGSAAPDWEIRG